MDKVWNVLWLKMICVVLNKLLVCCVLSLLSCILSYLCVACLVCCIVMTCCHHVIFRTYFDNFDRVQGNMNGPEALKSKKTTKSLKQQKAARLITLWRDFIGREASFWIAGNVTRLLEACHGCEEGSRRTLGCYKIVTRLNIGATRFLAQKIFPI